MFVGGLPRAYLLDFDDVRLLPGLPFEYQSVCAYPHAVVVAASCHFLDVGRYGGKVFQHGGFISDGVLVAFVQLQ